MRALLSIIKNKLKDIHVASPTSKGSHWFRAGMAIIKRGSELGIDGYNVNSNRLEELMEKFEMQIDINAIGAITSSAKETNSSESSRPEREQATWTQQPSYVSDGSRVTRAVQAHFSSLNKDDTSKFSGDLTQFPSFDMFEKRINALMESSFPMLAPEKRVIHLAEALTEDAQRFFMK